MKTAAPMMTIAATVISWSPALAASGAEYEGVGILMIMFMGFGAMIIAFQAVLVAMLLFTMVKALIAKPLIETPALASEQGEHDA